MLIVPMEWKYDRNGNTDGCSVGDVCINVTVTIIVIIIIYTSIHIYIL